MLYIDAHAHIYPDAIAGKASASITEFYNLGDGCDGRLETLRERGRLAGIERHIVLGVAITPGRVESINNYLMHMVAEHPGLLIGFGAIHPDAPDIRAELRRIKAGGLVGVKFHADMTGVPLDDPRVVQLLKLLAQENMPAMLHMGDPRYTGSRPARLAKALAAVPDVNVIAAHFGGWLNWEEAWQSLAHLDNVWVDTSSSLYTLPPDEAVALLRRYRPDRVVFGTDFPMWDPALERERFDALPLSKAQREAIGRRNIEAFLRRF